MVLDYACGFKEFLRRIMDCAMRNKSYAIASLVIPAKAGTQSDRHRRRGVHWVPAFAGMTSVGAGMTSVGARQEGICA